LTAPALEQALAEYLAAVLEVGLYSDADPALRVVFVGEEPPVPAETAAALADGADPYATTAQLTITVFVDGGAGPLLTLGEQHTITVQTRHPSYVTALDVAARIGARLHENGGAGANPWAQADFGSAPPVRVLRITADFPPIRLGRGEGEREGRYRCSQSFTVLCKPVPLIP
jgi:hypothetical protein